MFLSLKFFFSFRFSHLSYILFVTLNFRLRFIYKNIFFCYFLFRYAMIQCVIIKIRYYLFLLSLIQVGFSSNFQIFQVLDSNLFCFSIEIFVGFFIKFMTNKMKILICFVEKSQTMQLEILNPFNCEWRSMKKLFLKSSCNPYLQ